MRQLQLSHLPGRAIHDVFEDRLEPWLEALMHQQLHTAHCRRPYTGPARAGAGTYSAQTPRPGATDLQDGAAGALVLGGVRTALRVPQLPFEAIARAHRLPPGNTKASGVFRTRAWHARLGSLRGECKAAGRLAAVC
jgi:hypothetical protein